MMTGIDPGIAMAIADVERRIERERQLKEAHMDPEERLELIGLLAEDRGWDAVVAVGRALLNRHYHATVFDGSSGDAGPEYVVALRNAIARIDGQGGAAK
jgi:hypothetical protein